MAKKGTHENEMASFTLRHRALCLEGDFEGPWRSDLTDAQEDALSHQSEHHDHEIRIVTEQTLSMKFV